MGKGGVFLRKVRAGILDEPTGFVWVEDKRVAGSGLPASRSQVEWLSKQGIRRILTLTERPLPTEYFVGTDILSEHIAMSDHAPPSTESLERGATYLIGEVSDGNPVVVHCLAGQGRTGCVLAGYLMKTRGIGASEAMVVLRHIKPEFVESVQEKALFEYEKSLKQ